MSLQSFNYIFLLLPISLFAVWLGRRLLGAGAALGCLAAASLVFAGMQGIGSLIVILSSCLFNYAVALVLSKSGKRVPWSRSWLAGGILANLGLLAWFKFNNFLLVGLGSVFAGDYQFLSQALLPLGISYYTFQQIAYLIEIRRGLPAERNLLRYILYVTFFPKVVLGPIVRPQELLPQLSGTSLGRLNSGDLAQGLTLFLLGLAKKVILAGGLAPFADHCFNMAAQGQVPSLATSWGGMLAYSLQLYFDFSGYTDMALGAACMFGLRLPSNFASPYRSLNIADFWRRWHMSLSFWLRDYVYIPLGGSRRGRGRRYFNVMATMLICGIWHGTGWLFILWGGLHGLFIVIHNLWRTYLLPLLANRVNPLPATLRSWSARLFTFLCVSLAWVFFRAETLSSAGKVFQGLVGMGGIQLAPAGNLFMYWYLCCGLCVAWLLPEAEQYVLGTQYRTADASRWDGFLLRLRWRPSVSHFILALTLGLWALGRLAGGAHQFLYYQF